MSDEPTKIDCDPDLVSSDAQASLRPEHGNTGMEIVPYGQEGLEIIPLNQETQIAEGLEIIPLNEETQIAAQSEQQLSLPQQATGELPSEVTVHLSGGNFIHPNFGPQTNTKHVEANKFKNSTITHHHHYYGDRDSSSNLIKGVSNRGAKKGPSGEEYVQISDDIYKRKEPIRQGSKVYEGYQQHVTGEKIPLAIKMIVPCTDKDVKEVEHLLKLKSHPNVVRIIRSNISEGPTRVLYIAMELCSSQNLRDYMKQNRKQRVPFDFNRAMSYSRQLVEGVQHIHSHKIVHRDLKPENVLISQNGKKIKITDFGISKAVRHRGRATKLTIPGQGTEGYQAPETYKSDVLTQHADIFSLGATMFGLWTNGNHPFGSDPDLWLYNIKNNKGRDLSGLPEEMGTKSEEFLDLISAMLEFDPWKRPTIEAVSQHPFFMNQETLPKGVYRSARQDKAQAIPKKEGTEDSKPLFKKVIGDGVDSFLLVQEGGWSEDPDTDLKVGRNPGGGITFTQTEEMEFIQFSTATSDSSDSESPEEPLRTHRVIEETEEVNIATTSQGSASWKNIGHGMFIDDTKPLRVGYKVYRGEKRFPGGADSIPVAVKILDIIDSITDAKWPRKFRREINNLTKIHHTYVARFIDCDEMPGNTPKALYIATSLCHHKTLADIEISALRSPDRQNIFLQICHGLGYIHGRGIAHRDLKPNNILFSLDGSRAIVADFGLSKNVIINRERATISSASKYQGSLGWTAAEMISGCNANPDETAFLKADIFSLGLIGHFIYCDKHHPFCNQDEEQRVETTVVFNDPTIWHYHILQGAQPSFKKLKRMQASDGYIAADLFERMLSHDPEARPLITMIPQHFLFWCCSKKMDFFRDMHDRYFKHEHLQSSTERQRLAYRPVPFEPATKVRRMDFPNTVVASDPTSISMDVKHDEVRPSTSSGIEESHRGREVQRPEAQTCDAIPESWLERVKKDEKYQQVFRNQTEEGMYENNLKDLIKFMHNHHIHAMNQDEGWKTEESWDFFSQHFPQLLPYLYRKMEPAFCEPHREKYKHCGAKADEVDLTDILSRN